MAAPMAADPLASTSYMQQHHHHQQPPPPSPPSQQQQPQEPPVPGPARTQSFGLPSIPRTTSFGWGGTVADRAGAAQSPVAHVIDAGPHARTADAPSAMASRDANAQSMLPQQPQFGDAFPQAPHTATASFQHPPSHDRPDFHAHGHPNGHGSPPAHQEPNGAVNDMAPGQNAGLQPQQAFPSRGSPVPAQLSQMPGPAGSPSLQGQPFLAAGGLRAGASPPLGGNPIQRFPPSPKWRLEESHLTEPLYPSRKTNSPPSAQPGYYATDKDIETGATPAAALPPSDKWTPQESHLSGPLHSPTKKTQSAEVGFYAWEKDMEAGVARPPSDKWKPQKSQLTEPLHSPSKKTHGSSSAQPAYPPNDKDLEMGASATTPSQSLQRTRNSGLPPSTAQRFPHLFPAGGSTQAPDKPSAAPQQDQIQVVQIPRNGINDVPRTATNEKVRCTSGLSTDYDGHHDSVDAAPLSLRDDVSESSIPPPQTKEQLRRPSFLASHDAASANDASSSAPPSQEPHQDAGPQKEKKSFFGGAGLPVLSKKSAKAEPAASKSETQPKEHGLGGGAMKRLSDLKGIFKSSPNDDEQPAKPSPPQTARTSMQGPNRDPAQPQWPREAPHAQSGAQPGPQQAQTTAMQGPGSPRLRARDSQWPLSSGAPSAPHPQNAGDDQSRKPSTSFLGGIFSNRPGPKAQDHPKANAGYEGQLPTQPGHRTQPEHMAVAGQPPGARMMSPGQPGPHPGQFAPRPGQASPQADYGHGQPGPMAMGNTQAFQGFPGSHHPHVPGPNGGMGGMVAMRRVSQPPNIAPGSQQQQPQSFGGGDRPGLPSQRRSSASQHPNTSDLRPLGSNPIGPVAQSNDPSLAPPRQNSPALSAKPSNERLSVGGASIVPRTSPARKPVGSGPMQRDRGASVTLSQPPGAPTAQNPGPGNVSAGLKPDAQVTVQPIEGTHPALADQRLANKPSLTQLGNAATSGHTRQSSLAAPSERSTAQTQSSGSPDVSGVSGQMQHAPRSPGLATGNNGSVQSGVRHPGQPGQAMQTPGPGAPGQLGVGSGMGPSHQGLLQHQQSWGPQGHSRPATTSGAPGQQLMQPPMSAHQGGQPAAPSLENQKTPSSMSRIFGNRRVSTQVQPANQQGQPKESSRRFTGLFKRNSKQPEADSEQHKSNEGQKVSPHMTAAGRGTPGQTLPQEVQRAPMGPNPQASFPGSGPPPNMVPGRGQIPPHILQQMAAGRGQMPPHMMQHMAGRGQMPPQMAQQMYQMQQQQMQMQAGRGEQQPQQMFPQPSAPGQQQYAPVPIPRGYDAVHGYGGSSQMAPSPYNIGRGVPAGPMYYGQHPQPYAPMQQQQQQQQQQQFVQGQTPPQSHSPAPPSHHQSPPGSQSHSPAPQQHMMHSPPSTGSPAQQHMMQPPHQSGSPAPQQHVSPPRPSGSPAHMMHPPHASGSPAPLAQSPAPSQAAAGESVPRFVSPESVHDPRSQVNSVSPPQDQVGAPMSKPHTQHLVTTMDMQHGNPHIQHPGSPQNYPLPSSASTFSPVNPAAGRLPNPPAPPVDSAFQSQSAAANAQGISNPSHTPSPPMGLASSHNGNFSVMQEPQHNFSLSPRPSKGAFQSNSNTNLNVNVERANSHTPPGEDIYDATPRDAHAPREQGQASPAVMHQQNGTNGYNGAAIAGGAVAGAAAGVVAQDVMRSNSYFAEGSNGGLSGAAPRGSPSAATDLSNPVPTDVSSTPSGTPLPANPQFARPAEPEEKILVDEPAELAAAPDELDDGIPVMSATSYPGQEWNPYGYGEFGDFEA